MHGFTDDPSLLHDAVAHLRGHGVAVEPVDATALARVAPALAGAPLRGAWHLPTERVADPHALLTGFLRGLARQGGALRTGLPVTAL
ncbi:MAG: FAD-dependent oxidoreductase, partial [bacterium]